MTNLSPAATTSLVVALMAMANARPDDRPQRPMAPRKRPRPLRRARA